MPTQPTYLDVTETTLACSGLHDVAPELAEAIVEWLHAHGLDENRVAASVPIVRDPDRSELQWTANHRGTRVRIVDQAPLTAVGVWPAPFPQILLDQQRPPCCLACGRPYDDQDPVIL